MEVVKQQNPDNQKPQDLKIILGIFPGYTLNAVEKVLQVLSWKINIDDRSPAHQ